MALLGLATGDRIDFHATLFEGERDALDRLCRENKCSRGTIIGALLQRYQDENLDIPEGADRQRMRPRNKE